MVTRADNSMLDWKTFVVALIGALVLIFGTIALVDSQVNEESAVRPLLAIIAAGLVVLARFQYRSHGWNIAGWIGLDRENDPRRR